MDSEKDICEQALIQIGKIAPLLDRFQYWIVYFQTTAAPTVSLILYLIDDLKSFMRNWIKNITALVTPLMFFVE